MANQPCCPAVCCRHVLSSSSSILGFTDPRLEMGVAHHLAGHATHDGRCHHCEHHRDYRLSLLSSSSSPWLSWSSSPCSSSSSPCLSSSSSPSFTHTHTHNAQHHTPQASLRAHSPPPSPMNACARAGPKNFFYYYYFPSPALTHMATQKHTGGLKPTQDKQRAGQEEFVMNICQMEGERGEESC